MDRYRYLVGKSGEAAAAEEYGKNGYRVVSRNWRCGRLGEIDLILERSGAAGSDPLLVFSEVKTRENDSFAPAAAAVNGPKQRRIRMLASAFLSRNPQYQDYAVRFDVAEVYYGDSPKKNPGRPGRPTETDEAGSVPDGAARFRCEILENAF